MGLILTLHSLLRWAIVAVAAVAIVKFALGRRRGSQFGGMDRGLASAFSGLMDLQAVLGYVVLFGSGLAGEGFPAYRVEHAITMTIAVIVGHAPAFWKNAPDKVRYRNGLLTVVAVLALIFGGIASLPQGWLG